MQNPSDPAGQLDLDLDPNLGPIELQDDLEGDTLREECGVFGIFGHPEAAAITALGLHALQHRGQEAAGIVSFDGSRFHSERRRGLVGDTFSRREVIERHPRHKAGGHLRDGEGFQEIREQDELAGGAGTCDRPSVEVVGGRVVAEVASGCAGKAEPAGVVEGLGQHDGLAQQRRAPGGIALQDAADPHEQAERELVDTLLVVGEGGRAARRLDRCVAGSYVFSRKRDSSRPRNAACRSAGKASKCSSPTSRWVQKSSTAVASRCSQSALQSGAT